MVEFPYVVSAERKGCAAEETYLRWCRLRTLILLHQLYVSQAGHPTQDVNGKLAYPPQPYMRGRMSLQPFEICGKTAQSAVPRRTDGRASGRILIAS
jgi:hypothetical protein